MKALIPLLFLLLSGCSDPLEAICAEQRLIGEETGRETVLNCLHNLSTRASVAYALEVCGD